MFFKNHPKTLDNKNNIVTDISAIVSFLDSIKGTNYCLEYYIEEGDTPESISHKFYQTQDYSWSIMLLNEFKDITRDWPMSATNFNSYIIDKYGDKSALFLKLESVKNYNINPGDKIKIMNTNNNYAEVVEWNASLSKLVIKYLDENIVPYTKNSIISFVDHNMPLATIGRVVHNNSDALHHFEYEKNHLDPLTGYLNIYINSDSMDYVITNYEYEVDKNNKKRFIYLIKTDLIDNVLRNYYQLMNR